MAESKPAVLSETAVPPLLLHAAERVRANAPLIGLLALGHLIVDVNQGALSAVLPFVKTAHGLSYAQDYLQADPRIVGVLLFLFLGAGAVGTVIAGPLADRWGALAYVRWIFLAVVPLGVLFLLVDGALRLVVLAVFGAVLTSSFSVSIVLAQAYLPSRPGMASGLMVGFAMGTGGLAATALGGVADRWGVPAALWISALIPIVAFVGARFLPAPRDRTLAIA
jgi:FSR family fosmidomycin resistance protein-like MFS transporter